MKRRITDEERAEFKAHIDQPRPLKAVAKKSSKPGRNRSGIPADALIPARVRSAPAGKMPVTALAARKAVGATKPGGDNKIDGHTGERLKRGQLQPGARLDLHGMTEGAAHGALLSFLASAQARGVRLALVVTGVGNPKDHEGAEWMRPRHGVLKEMVPRWLNEKDFAALVVGAAPAHRRHGGEGAFYVYLRKRP